MYYFNNLPLITKTDYNNNSVVVNNLLARSYIIPSLLKNITIFYEYDVKDGDTPENIAYRYYSDPYRYWLVFYSNNIIDPQSEWPLTYEQLQPHLIQKYKQDTANTLSIPVANVTSLNVLSYIAGTIHHYEKIVTTSDSSNFQSQVITIQIDEDTYTNLMEVTNTATFPDTGVVATVSITKNAVTIYDYEQKLNESKRTIQIINSIYATDMEKKYKSLMGQ
jgi:Base plate wedge protein 53